MVRRNKPKITGTDPNYAHTFERYRPVESDMPADVKIPSAEALSDTTPKKAQPSSTTPVATKPKTTTAKPKTTKSKTTSPKPTNAAPALKKAATKPDPKQRGEVTPTTTEERQTTLDAAVRVDQAEAMRPLTEKGLKQRDIVMLAGRKTTEKFVLSPTFVPKPEAERLPMQEGYHTSKRLDGAILDAMRDEHDPLRVRSDPAMVRGQFETLFWKTLDEVIKELRAKYT